MSLLNIIVYLAEFAACYFSFIVLQRHYTRKMTWGAAIMEGCKHIAIGLVVALGSPAGVLLLCLLGVFIILTLGDLM